MNQHSDKTSRTSEFRPTATWDILVRRAELLGQLRSFLHNPEFTIVEWYRRHDQMDDGIEFLSRLADSLLHRGPAEKLSYQAAFLKYANVDPLKTNVEQLQAQCAKLGVSIPAQLDSELDNWLELLLTEVVQPRLGQQTPVILYNFPASQAALANVCELDQRVARRFELFIDGIEVRIARQSSIVTGRGFEGVE